jgi:hypothetical protein
MHKWLKAISKYNISRMTSPGFCLYSILYDEPESPPPLHGICSTPLDLLLFDPIQEVVFSELDASGDLFHMGDAAAREVEAEQELTRVDLKIRDLYWWPDLDRPSSLIPSDLINEANPTATFNLAMVVFNPLKRERASREVFNWLGVIIQPTARRKASDSDGDLLLSLSHYDTKQARDELCFKYLEGSAFVVKDRIVLCEDIIPVMLSIIEACEMNPATTTHAQLAERNPLLRCMHPDCLQPGEAQRRTLLRRHDAVGLVFTRFFFHGLRVLKHYFYIGRALVSVLPTASGP